MTSAGHTIMRNPGIINIMGLVNTNISVMLSLLLADVGGTLAQKLCHRAAIPRAAVTFRGHW